MTSPARSRRIAAARVWVLAALVTSHLPLPVVHSHEVSAASAGLSRHLALFHGAGGGAEASRPHLHVVPPMFLAGGGLTDATGDETPAPLSRDTIPVDSAQLDAPDLVLWAEDVCPDEAPLADSDRPFGFHATYARGYDRGGLLGACRR